MTILSTVFGRFTILKFQLIFLILGLIYTVDINEDSEVKIAMTLTAPGCPVAGEMPGWVAEAIEPLPGVKHVDVELVWEPPWGMDMMSDEARLELGFM